MKKIYLLLFIVASFSGFSQISWQGGITPESDQVATILFDKAGTGLASYSGTIYAHTGVTVDDTPWQNVIGNWGDNGAQPSLTLVSGTIYKLEITPSIQDFYSVVSGTISKINIVFRSDSGTQQTGDLELNVGAFMSNLTAPVLNSTTIINSGESLFIEANNNNGNANYNLKANGISIDMVNNVATYSFNHINILENQSYDLEITQGAITQTKSFSVIVNPSTITEAMASGLENGINYNITDFTKATLVLEAPGKDFIYVAGSFNNWQPDASYAMKKDPVSEKFWLEITGLISEQIETYQYWVVDETPIANSPALVKVADPCSTLVLSPYDDPWISSTSFPNLPTYPVGQEREVTVLQTGQTPYNWQVTNFNKPNKDNLVVYELLVRDFDANRNFQDVIDRIDYLKNLGINAIELMPVMEFEGNESWGYNTSFHMALDKFYGTKDKLKELIDLCHQNDIAVILDIAFNHAFGRNPMVRMWMNDPDGDGWGNPSTENPYFNTIATHSYSVGEDFDHSSTFTRDYVKQTLKYWINEFKIDGFRWDLTKGFTQNATGSDALTNQFQQDRVDVLKEYVDYSWSIDDTHYAIFEHLGSDGEEQEWANYRIAEDKGIMMWGELFSSYKQLAMGYASNASISRMGHVSRGFTGKRLIGYSESHDKDRLMYEAVTYGEASGNAPVNGNLNNALNRMGAIGATSILIPGPKMLWHFQELGMDDSIYTCSNGSVNSESDAISGNCKLDTKPQPQWAEDWLADPIRSTIYQKYARLINLKKSEAVFNGEYAISPEAGDNLKQRIYIYDNSIPATELKNVVILANFSVSDASIIPDFPFTGTWYDLMDDTPYVVTNATTPITIPAGQFRIFGNQSSVLSSSNFEVEQSLVIYPNPTKNTVSVSSEIEKMEVYTLSGQLIKRFENISVNKELNIQELQQGMYLIKAFYNATNFVTRKIVKE
ncbi:T9SS type A sorting domain-containing protein [Flavobacterium sediminilitoris]|uniref:T9SS type A sorting domain-containing protein n=1 Tax=Flavobacterium sediminilitoris TaxID=2024526 RepID=A0ABY4HS70_9FLAO|nr:MULTISPECIES: alpha-amylase family glycosyl hydrolase [Flavobacterium]UOX35451.1 T9SS type A sorting domain-containing protein [Flavobacterium sediminilitoris]